MKFPAISIKPKKNMTLREKASVTLLVWFAAILLFALAVGKTAANRVANSNASTVISLSSAIKAYPASDAGEDTDTLTELSRIMEDTGIKEKVSQLTSSQYGTVVKLDKLSTWEFTVLVKDITTHGMEIKAAEVKASSHGKDGRLITASLTIGGGK